MDNQGLTKVQAILSANHRRFLEFLKKRVGNTGDAEEILQNAFVRSLGKAEQLRNSESAVAWFYRLLRNAVVDHYRRRTATHRSLDKFAQQLMDTGKALHPDTEREICRCVKNLIAFLDPEYAEIIHQVDVLEKDVSAAAAIVGITPGNARVRLHRARKALRQLVERSCRTCATHGCLDCTCSKTDDSGEPVRKQFSREKC